MKITRGCAISALMVLACALGAAQTYQGRISGTVTDKSGAVVVGAKVQITNMDTGATRDLVSNEAGDWVAPNLAPGPYKITVEAPKFKKVERTGVRLEVAKDIHLDTVLVPGAASEVVTVTEEAPLVETTNAALGGTFANRAINDLPLNGRDFQNLVVLRPGVQRGTGGGFLSISSNGNRPEDNNFIIDGTDNNDPYYGTTVVNAEGVQGTPGTVLPIDAIQEFNAEENPPAEYGWKPGAIINLGLKSGTNTLHGSAYGFERNSALDARNYFNSTIDPSTGLPEAKRALRQHQFGASIGGPIVKNKTFFFGAYEGVRALVSNSTVLPVPSFVGMPTPGEANCAFTLVGDCANSVADALNDLAAGGIIAAPNLASVNSLSATVLGLYPANNTPIASMSFGLPNKNRMDDFIVKIDHHFNDHHSITGRYFFGDSLQQEQDIPVLRQEWESTSQLRAQVLGVNWTWTPNARWVNEAKFGYNRFWQAIQTADHNANPQTVYGINTGVTDPVNFGMPTILVGDFNQLGGNRGWPLLTVPNATFQGADSVSWTHGRHTLRFGGEFRHGQTHNLRDRSGKGRVRFQNGGNAFTNAGVENLNSTGLEDFLVGIPDRGDVFIGSSERFVAMNSIGWFVQDDWRLSPRLMLSFGVRYDWNGVIHERDNLLGNFDPAVGLQQVGVNIDKPYNNDNNNFAPRFGVAWDIFGTGKTVLRAGGGITYEIPILATFLGQNGVNNAVTPGLNVIPTGAHGSNLFGNGGTIQAQATSFSGGALNWTTAGPVFNIAAGPDCDPTSPTGFPCDLMGVDHNLRTPYVTNWTVNIQQAITKSLALQVAYVGNKATKMYGIVDINQVDPNSPAENNPPVCDHCEQAGRPFNTLYPFLGFINFLGNYYNGSYNGLQTTLTQRSWHGLSYVLGYTWSHSIDQASLHRAQQPQNSLLPGLERGNSDLDIRHRATLSLMYELPGRKGYAQMLEGWQLNSIVTLQSGQPWTIYDYSNDTSLTGEFSDRWDLFGSPKDFRTSPVPLTPDGTVYQFVDDCSTLSASMPARPCYHAGNSFIVQPEPGHFGNLGRNSFVGPGLYNWDFSVVKNFKFGERLGMQIRAEFFNVLNNPHFANPQSAFLAYLANDVGIPSNLGLTNLTPDVAAANPVIGTGGARNIQLGLKFRW